MTAVLADALLDHLCEERDSAQAGDQWVMSTSWRDSLRSLEGACGEALLIPSPDGREFLFGVPVEIRKDGGVPHLEPV